MIADVVWYSKILEMWTELPRIGRGKKKVKPVNKSCFISKLLFTRGFVNIAGKSIVEIERQAVLNCTRFLERALVLAKMMFIKIEDNS